MNIKTYLKGSKILHSLEADKGAEAFMETLYSGGLRKDILQNSAEQFPGRLEEENYISYCKFLSSINGKFILDLLEEFDHDRQ